MSRPIVCRCEHSGHFEKDTAKLPEGNGDSNHPYGAPCTYVVRAWDDSGLLVCAACDKVGHASRPAANSAIRRNQDAEVFEKDKEA